MTYQEFINLLPEDTRIPTEKEYKVIERVYVWHPSIRENAHEGQEQMIARLYSEFGMRIIYDMEDTARKMESLKEARDKAKKALEDVEKEIVELIYGRKAGESE